MTRSLLIANLTIVVGIVAGEIVQANSWADAIVDYDPGTGITNDFVTGTPFDDPSTVLGEPTRFTSDPANFGAPVTPFGGPFRNDEVVSVGYGGHLTVSFDEPVTDDPLNPFGVDLLVFGNSAYLLDPFASDGVAGSPFTDGGIIEVSADGTDYYEIVGVEADGLFPTMGYQDITDPLATTSGAVLTDFTRPVDPGFDPTGLMLGEIVAAYDGSGGGVGIDLATVGLSAISFVRISTASDAALIPEIDALADVRAVPEPTSATILAATLACWCGLRKR